MSKNSFFIEHLWWLLVNSNLIVVMDIVTKTERSYFHILIITMQTKLILLNRCDFFL